MKSLKSIIAFRETPNRKRIRVLRYELANLEYQRSLLYWGIHYRY